MGRPGVAGTAGDAVRLRDARTSDRRLLWQWANDPEVRRNSFSSDPIPWSRHVAWFTRMLRDPDCRLLIAETPSDGPVGQVRFEPDNAGGYRIGITVGQSYRGKGLASPVITAAVRRWRLEHPHAPLAASIKPANKASIAAFTRSGFVADATEEAYDRVVMRQHPAPSASP